MKGASHPKNDVTLAESSVPSIRDVIDSVEASRRQFVKSGLSATALASVGGLSLGGLVSTVQAAPVPASLGFPGIGFESVPANTRALNVSQGGLATQTVDKITVPAGYTANVFVSWGDAIMPGGTAFSGNASETSAQQARQFGMHNDGMHFFPFANTNGTPSSDRGILAVNNEYTHEDILYTDGQNLSGGNYTFDKTRKSQNAHGVSIVEARRVNGKWSVIKNSIYGRRVTANTLTRVSGPAAGHALMKAKAYSITATATTPTGGTTDGFTAYGTIQLRPRHHALGHLPGLRRKLQRQLLQRQRRAYVRGHRNRQVEPPLWHLQLGLRRLQLAQERRALRPGQEPQRTPPVRLGRGNRPVRPPLRARQAHRPGPLQARKRSVRC